ncbi:MAG: dTDP-4-dehydrorhamnose 3,5-epimerase [Ignavibacteriales bacterium]|nr:MAG: dTDP-4-dehydrorhamnose 3,5-epimerase [Ignavibacteriaceae bacterium]MBW7873340.1 dTDP-4-dehydrorhamnose 3,5-epimerase [Ignavibacteria bacterium]MCZ2142030.1 dTDP-4-dehydrorhamnose 3,5-epimerase [Ignavibacteriales bacterium]MBV6444767.1 dTDP-4-dehydrorhamnose 3,5-epimerase [Ignavibacteriaceae bacterium]MBZ0197848.1 dTDP-4-dehydrorhamnose 3,5-epimerase [Ignavibacteriaceae bacterium]
MKIINGKLDGIRLIVPRVFPDQRGFFFECFREDIFKEAGINYNFVQDNLSRSAKGTIRGLHFQIPPYEQGKLCQVVQGAVLDVVVDIRVGSPTYGQHFSAVLSDENHHILWIPPGFAHGFSVLSEVATFHYKCTAVYSKESERTLFYNDPELGIDWQTDAPVVSEKDTSGVPLSRLGEFFTFNTI